VAGRDDDRGANAAGTSGDPMPHDGPMTESPESAPGDVVPTGRPNARLRQTVRDMVLSMAVVLAVVFLIVLLAWRPQPDPIKVVEVGPAITQAAQQADFPVVAPNGLSGQWRPTSARWEPTEESGSEPVLHLGYVTPSDEYAQVSLSNVDDPRYLDEQTAGASATGTQAVGDVTWERWETQERKSLVLRRGGTVLIVSGTGAWDELVALAKSIQPVTTS
jgi:hypothetical protein